MIQVEIFLLLSANIQSNIYFDTLSNQIILFSNYLIQNAIKSSSFKSSSKKLFVFTAYLR